MTEKELKLIPPASNLLRKPFNLFVEKQAQKLLEVALYDYDMSKRRLKFEHRVNPNTANFELWYNNKRSAFNMINILVNLLENETPDLSRLDRQGLILEGLKKLEKWKRIGIIPTLEKFNNISIEEIENYKQKENNTDLCK
ncbi:MAG: hypothetical protein Q4G09_06790 [Clostridia bacterium]|nr:hypothetical protein [Clostridia bacterium]